MSNLTVLKRIAQVSKPESLPASVLLTHTPTSLTIFDAFPKSIFHFLILPRVVPPFTESELANLRSLLKSDKERAKGLLFKLRDDANAVKQMIEDEMVSRYGYKWGIWVGFHAVPSMDHVHLHVLSNDMCSPTMKTKKHVNSFHPKLGFFLHFENVLEWFDAEPSFYDTMSDLTKSQYEPLLKDDLSCWRCGEAMKNMPTLKTHLQEEWENERRKEKIKLAKKGKAKQDPQEDGES